jgi:hypothetical protein
VAFLRIAHEEIKAVDPRARVSYGGLALQPWEDRFHLDFMDRFLEAGGARYTDIENYHWFAHLSRVPGQPSGPEKHGWLMDSLRRHGASGKPVWLTETYQLTYTGRPESEAEQIGFLSKEIVTMLALPEIERIYWYSWIDNPPEIGDADQIGRGLVRHDGVPKPAADILPLTVAATNGRPQDESRDGVVATRFRWPRTGHDALIAWSADGSERSLDVAVPARQRLRLRWFPEISVMSGECCPSQIRDAAGGIETITVGKDAVFVDFVPRDP